MIKQTSREFYVPKNMTQIPSIDGTELYISDVGGSILACGFSGKKAKYDFYNRFITKESRDAFIKKWQDKIKSWADVKQKRKDERKAPHTIKVGDIMYTSWGYEQTNVDWYQVTKLIGSRMVELRKIYGSSTPDNLPDRGTTVPIKDAFIDGVKPIRKLVTNNSVNIASYARAWAWDGKSKYYSTYA
jgi:hypothetical protein